MSLSHADFDTAAHAAELASADRLLGYLQVELGSHLDFNGDKVSIIFDEKVDLAWFEAVISLQQLRSSLQQVRLGELLPPFTELDVVPTHARREALPSR